MKFDRKFFCVIVFTTIALQTDCMGKKSLKFVSEISRYKSKITFKSRCNSVLYN